MVIHPWHLFGALEPTYYEEYKRRNHVLALSSYKALSDMMIKKSLVKIKEHPPYVGDMEGKVLLNSMARATFDPKTGEYSFKGKLAAEVLLDVANAKAFSTIAATNGLTDGSTVGFGVDQGSSDFVFHGLLTYIYLLHQSELIFSVPSHNSIFVSRNFTEAEITYCRSQPSLPSSFAARWVGKEAVFKSLGMKSKGATAAMKDIEIVNDESGVPTVRLHGEAKAKQLLRASPKS